MVLCLKELSETPADQVYGGRAGSVPTGQSGLGGAVESALGTPALLVVFLPRFPFPSARCWGSDYTSRWLSSH